MNPKDDGFVPYFYCYYVDEGCVFLCARGNVYRGGFGKVHKLWVSV